MSTTLLLDHWAHSFSDWWSKRSTTDRGYVCGALVLVLSFGLSPIATVRPLADVGLYAGSLLFALALLAEAYAWIVPKLEYRLVKLVAAGVSFMALAAATGVSKLAVNDATGQDSIHFVSAVGFLVPLSFLPVICVFLIVASVASLVPIVAWGALKNVMTRQKPTDFELFVFLSRLLAVFAVTVIPGQMLAAPSKAWSGMHWLAGNSAFILDLHPNHVCGEGPRDRVVRVNDNLVIVGRQTKEGPQFVRRACTLLPEEAALRPAHPSVEN